MYADHPVTGVGGGNFGSFYTHYKAPSALETVADPHNFILSLLTQYGPLGLIGFLAIVSIPLWRTATGQSDIPLPKDKQQTPTYTKLTIPFLIVIGVVLLFIRPFFSPLPATGSPEERYAGIVVLYIIPAIVFIVGFLLITAGRISNKADYMNISLAVLFCGCLGVLIHNLIDFAIFEPGVLTTFWVVVACFVAMDCMRRGQGYVVLRSGRAVAAVVSVLAAAVLGGYIRFALMPAASSSAAMREAGRAASVGAFARAHELLEQGAREDVLCSSALSMDARVYLSEYASSTKKDTGLLLKSRERLLRAIERNRAAFKDYERLGDVCLLLAQASQGVKKMEWLEESRDAVSAAAVRYPGSGRLDFKLGQVFEQRGEMEAAAEAYGRAVEIEDSYRAQFRRMYPEMDRVVSRLGEENYETAKRRMEAFRGGSSE